MILAHSASRARNLPLWKPFFQRDFQLVWLGQSISLLGDQLHFVALAWLTLQLTGSGVALGTVLMAGAVPRALLMLPGGAISDRFSTRTIMLASNAGRGGIAAAIALLIALHTVALWNLYLLAFLFGLVDAFFYPALGRIVPMLIDGGCLQAANALMQGAKQLSLVVGPAVAGVLVSLVGTWPAFAIDAGSFLFAATTILLMHGPAQDAAPREQRESLTASIRAGLMYAWHDPALRAILLIVAAIDFSFVGPISVGLPYLSAYQFHAGSSGFGTLVSAWGGGTLLGIVAGGLLGCPRRPGVWLLLDTAIVGLGLAVLGLAPTIEAAAIVLGIMGVGSGCLNVVGLSWLQARTDDRLLGRVMSIVVLASTGLGPLSYALSGMLVQWNSALTFALAGAIILLTTVLVSGSPAVRTLPQSPHAAPPKSGGRAVH